MNLQASTKNCKKGDTLRRVQERMGPDAMEVEDNEGPQARQATKEEVAECKRMQEAEKQATHDEQAKRKAQATAAMKKVEARIAQEDEAARAAYPRHCDGMCVSTIALAFH